eukprot:gene21072-32467_t
MNSMNRICRGGLCGRAYATDAPPPPQLHAGGARGRSPPGFGDTARREVGTLPHGLPAVKDHEARVDAGIFKKAPRHTLPSGGEGTVRAAAADGLTKARREILRVPSAATPTTKKKEPSAIRPEEPSETQLAGVLKEAVERRDAGACTAMISALNNRRAGLSWEFSSRLLYACGRLEVPLGRKLMGSTIAMLESLLPPGGSQRDGKHLQNQPNNDLGCLADTARGTLPPRKHSNTNRGSLEGAARENANRDSLDGTAKEAPCPQNQPASTARPHEPLSTEAPSENNYPTPGGTSGSSSSSDLGVQQQRSASIGCMRGGNSGRHSPRSDQGAANSSPPRVPKHVVRNAASIMHSLVKLGVQQSRLRTAFLALFNEPWFSEALSPRELLDASWTASRIGVRVAAVEEAVLWQCKRRGRRRRFADDYTPQQVVCIAETVPRAAAEVAQFFSLRPPTPASAAEGSKTRADSGPGTLPTSGAPLPRADAESLASFKRISVRGSLSGPLNGDTVPTSGVQVSRAQAASRARFGHVSVPGLLSERSDAFPTSAEAKATSGSGSVPPGSVSEQRNDAASRGAGKSSPPTAGETATRASLLPTRGAPLSREEAGGESPASFGHVLPSEATNGAASHSRGAGKGSTPTGTTATRASLLPPAFAVRLLNAARKWAAGDPPRRVAQAVLRAFPPAAVATFAAERDRVHFARCAALLPEGASHASAVLEAFTLSGLAEPDATGDSLACLLAAAHSLASAGGPPLSDPEGFFRRARASVARNSGHVQRWTPFVAASICHSFAGLGQVPPEALYSRAGGDEGAGREPATGRIPGRESRAATRRASEIRREPTAKCKAVRSPGASGRDPPEVPHSRVAEEGRLHHANREPEQTVDSAQPNVERATARELAKCETLPHPQRRSSSAVSVGKTASGRVPPGRREWGEWDLATRVMVLRSLKGTGEVVAEQANRLVETLARRGLPRGVTLYDLAVMLQVLRVSFGGDSTRIPESVGRAVVEYVASDCAALLQRSEPRGLCSVLYELNSDKLSQWIGDELRTRGLGGFTGRMLASLAFCHALARRWQVRFWAMLEHRAREPIPSLDLRSCFVIVAAILQVKHISFDNVQRAVAGVLNATSTHHLASVNLRQALWLSVSASKSADPRVLQTLVGIVEQDTAALTVYECSLLARSLVASRVVSPALFRTLRQASLRASKARGSVEGGQKPRHSSTALALRPKERLFCSAA